MFVAAWAPLLVVVVLSYLIRHQNAQARVEEGGTYVLEYGPAFRWLAIAIGALWTALFVFLALASPPKPDDMPAVYILIAIATGTLAPFAITVWGVSYRLSPSGFGKRSPWSKNFVVGWQEIRSVTFNKAMSQFVVETAAGSARISTFVNGIKDFRAALENHVAAETWSKAKPYL